jgi:Domain of unknown function (DUF4347)/Domain of unknown function (DUF4082)
MLWKDNSVCAPTLEGTGSSFLIQPSIVSSSSNIWENSSSTVRTIAFVDAAVADAMTVMANLQSDVKILLDPNQDGIDQITQALSHYQGLTGIEIISHGNTAQVQLGTNALDASSLSQYANKLQQWTKSLTPDADILFYGCNIAADAAGQAFVQELGSLTGADIAASTNLTGAVAKGGDWNLEYTTGQIETATPFTASLMTTYQGLLASVFSTQLPTSPSVTDGVGSAGDYELGMEFTSAKAGQINAIRYYKSPLETGNHTGRIWSSTGTLLGTVAFTGETASGWQQQALTTPLNIAANTTYVVSVNANSYFATTTSGLSTTITNGDLRAVADGSNGVYNSTPGAFPIASYSNSNYFRDVVFTPSPTTTGTESVFSTQLPTSPSVTDGVGSAGDYELGMEFTSAKAGQINAIRYYKSPLETGNHTGRIWSSTGTLLGTVAFTGETASGWQQQALTTPLNIAANTTYVVSVNANSYFATTTSGLSTTITNGDLSAVADGSNGVYNSTPGAFPIASYSNSNYFRDIVFTPSAAPSNQPGTITVSGTARQNQTLTANVADLNGLAGVTIKYKWQQSSDNGTNWTDITGATAKTLTLDQSLVNKRIRATATYTDTLGTAESPLSIATAAVVNVNDLGKVILKGSATVNRTLTETVLDDDGLTGVNINYVWQQSSNGTAWTNISGATTKSLALGSSLLGKQVRLRANYIDALGSTETVFSLGTTIAAQNEIVLENQKTGTSDWLVFDTLATNNEIAGYGDANSINKGQSLNLKVSLAQAGKYNIDVYRLGYYNGDGGRLISSATGLNGVKQAAPTIDPTTKLVEYNWNTSYTLLTGANWVSGLYLAKLTDSTTGKQSYVEFTLRDDNRPAELGFQEAVTTNAAYNNYGGYSLYSYNSINNQEAYKVSLDRPFTPNSIGILTWEYNMARWLESQGYDISYYSNIDVHTNPFQLFSQNAFLSVGHDEYWSLEMRNNVEKARDNGANLGFFSANTAYWRTRFEPSSTGQANRVLAVYKDNWALDPIAQADNSQATNQFRTPQNNRPENALLGVMYTGQTDNFAGGFNYVVSNAADPYYAGTGLSNGDSIPGLVGYEWDAVVNNGSTPPGLVVLSQSPVVPNGVGPYLPAGTNINVANSIRYTAASGAKVFSTGSIQWAWGLDSDLVTGPRTSPVAQKITTNVLADLGAQAQTPQIFPATVAQPAPASLSPASLSPASLSIRKQRPIPQLPKGIA